MKFYCGACVLASVLAFGIACGAQSGKPAKDIDYDELAKLLEQPGKVFFLDVREPSEIASLGSVKGYVNIPLSQLEGRLKEVPRDKLIVSL
jgi:rhodanese-related sulfurtransferase